MVGLLFFLSLSYWQVWRGWQTQAKLDAQQRVFSLPYRSLQPNDIKDWQAYEFLPVSVQGRWLSERQFLQDNVTLNGQAGFEVITPLQVGNAILLVNRGWLSKLHYMPAKLQLQERELVELQGHLAKPLRRFSLGEEVWSASFPVIMQVMDLAKISQRLGLQVLPLQLRLSADNVAVFNSQWTPVFGNPQRITLMLCSGLLLRSFCAGYFAFELYKNT